LTNGPNVSSSGLDTNNTVQTSTYTFNLLQTETATAGGTLSSSLSQSGARVGGSYSLDSYVRARGMTGDQTFQTDFTQTQSGHGNSVVTSTNSGNDSASFGGGAQSVFGSGSQIDASSFGYSETITQTSLETLHFARSYYEAGTYGNARFALSSVGFFESVSDTWSKTALQCSTASGTETITGGSNDVNGGTLGVGGQTQTSSSNETANFTTTQSYTATS